MNKSGGFIVFEGIDGAGKSLQIDNTKKWLLNKGLGVTITREPGGTAIGAKIRSLLLDPENQAMDTVTELMLYAADRAQHIAEVILPAIEEGKIVLCDRFTLSTLAYQGYGRGLDINLIHHLNHTATGGLTPELTLVLDIDPQTARARIAHNRGSAPDRLEQEKEDFFAKVRQGYLAAADDEKIVLIDGSKEPQEVFAQIKPRLEALKCTGS